MTNRSRPLTISLEGDLDITQRDALEWKLKPAFFADPVVIDLAEVRYIDSSALSALIRLRKAREQRGYAAELLVAPSIHVRKLLAITQLDAVWNIYDTLEEALQAMEALPDLPA